MNASTALADTLLRQAGSPLGQSTSYSEDVSFPRASTRLSRTPTLPLPQALGEGWEGA